MQLSEEEYIRQHLLCLCRRLKSAEQHGKESNTFSDKATFYQNSQQQKSQIWNIVFFIAWIESLKLMEGGRGGGAILWRYASVSKTQEPPTHTQMFWEKMRLDVWKERVMNDWWTTDERCGRMDGCAVYAVGEGAECSSECWPDRIVPAGITARIIWPTEHRCVCKD